LPSSSRIQALSVSRRGDLGAADQAVVQGDLDLAAGRALEALRHLIHHLGVERVRGGQHAHGQVHVLRQHRRRQAKAKRDRERRCQRCHSAPAMLPALVMVPRAGLMMSGLAELRHRFLPCHRFLP
jgi:hypothetical protein